MARNPTPWPPGQAADEFGGSDTRRIVRGPVQQASVLVIAGLDPSGGAGLLADAHVVSQHGFHVAGTVTALTEQDSVMCSWMHPTDASMVSNQIARLIDDLEIRGVKVGMLANPEMAMAVARSLKRLAEMKVPIVVDPVLRATRGIPLLEGNAKQALAPLLAHRDGGDAEPRRAGGARPPITSRTTPTPCAVRRAASSNSVRARCSPKAAISKATSSTCSSTTKATRPSAANASKA